MLDEENKRNDLNKKTQGELFSTTACSAQHRSFSSNSRNKTSLERRNKFLYRCYNCGIKGHKKSDCNKKPQFGSKLANVTKGQYGQTDVESFCFPAVNENVSENEIKWYLDSGATEHLIDDKVMLKNVMTLENPIRIKVAKSGIFLYAKQVCRCYKSSKRDTNSNHH